MDPTTKMISILPLEPKKEKTTEELIEIANKFGIDIKNENNKKKTKKEIYEQLILNF